MVKKKKSSGKKKKSVKQNQVSSVESLIERGTDALSNLQLELAEECFTEASLLSPEDTNLMDALADVFLQLGKSDDALALLTKSTFLEPTKNPLKWLFIAQLQTGEESLNSYNQAISLIHDQVTIYESQGQLEDAKVLSKQITKAHCSIAELYLTDLWFISSFLFIINITIIYMSIVMMSLLKLIVNNTSP